MQPRDIDRADARPQRRRMESPSIELCPEITRDNAFAMMDWLRDEEVTRYLADSRSVSRDIAQVVSRVNLPTLTHLFNRGGRFFMVHDAGKVPVGFVRLVRQGADYEMVMVIGDRDKWGRKLGTSTLHQSLRLAFIELRAESLIARIHPANLWSLRAFRNCGFVEQAGSGTLLTFRLTRDCYFARSRSGAAARPDIRITRIDKARLQQLITAAQGRREAEDPMLRMLEVEVERAIVLPPQQVPADVVTMNSKARLRLNDQVAEVALVYPEHADRASQSVSVLSPLGTAVLGFREGDVIDWPGAEGHLTIHIEKVLYQPEAAGHFHL